MSMDVEGAILHLHEGNGRIEAKVDQVLLKLSGHDIRIRSVEQKQWFMSGGIAIAVALVMPKIKALFGY